MSKNLISEKVRKIADELKANHDVNIDQERVEFSKADDVFANNLPEGLTPEVVDKTIGSLVDFSAGHALALGEVALEAHKGKRDLGVLRSRVKAAGVQHDVSYRGEESGSVNGKEWKRYGSVRADMTVGVGRGAAPVRNAIKYIGEEAASIFNN